jgi:RNA polymerase-binding transcription factor DksA
MDLGLERAQRARQNQVKEALQRIQRGTYGRGAHCNRPIEIDRLRRSPWTDRCSGCARDTRLVPESVGKEG